MMQYLVLSIAILMFLFDFFVSMLNDRQKNKPLPVNVSNIYDEEKYNKWLNYSMDNLRLSSYERITNFVILISMLIFKVFGQIENFSQLLFKSPLLQLLLFMLIFLMITSAINLPFKIHQTFKIEEKYGFNKSTKKTFISDQIKSFILIVILGGGLVSLLFSLYQAFSSNVWLLILTLWASITLITLIIFVLNTKVFIKLFNKLTPLEDGILKDKIHELSNQVGFNVQAISIMDASKRSTKLNAFFSGLGKTREVVLYDTLVEKLDDDEILAVLAHELGHAKNNDVTKMLIFQSLIFFIYISIFVVIMQTTSLFTPFGVANTNFGFGIILFSILFSPISILISILTNHLSRIAEYKADYFSAKLTDKSHISSALIKLFKENLSNLNPHPLYVLLNYNHPEATKRLKRIDEIK
jgi:STE24 endopeptidase